MFQFWLLSHNYIFTMDKLTCLLLFPFCLKEYSTGLALRSYNIVGLTMDILFNFIFIFLKGQNQCSKPRF